MTALEKQISQLTLVNKCLIEEVKKLRQEMSKLTSSMCSESRFVVVSGSETDEDKEDDFVESDNVVLHEKEDEKKFIFPYNRHIDLNIWLAKSQCE